MKRGGRESRASAQGRAGFTRSKIQVGKGGGGDSERMEKAVKYHFIASPCGGHIQMCLCAEWVQDHIEKIIEGMTEGTRLRGEKKKKKKRGEAVESIKDGIQRKHRLPFSPLLPISLLPL